MEKINLNDINFSSLQKLKTQGTQSTIYTDGNICYKIVDGLYPSEKRELYEKFIAMDGIKIDNVILPKDLIVKNGKLEGYTMDYFKDSMPLSDKFEKRYFNCKDLFNYVVKASATLRDIHNNGIICQDLSFENLLVNDNGEIVFCDMDGCNYGRFNSPFCSIVLKDFLVDYRKSHLHIKEDIDKLSMILSFYLIVYGEVLQKITKKQYHILSDNIHTLENLRHIANILVNKDFRIENLPYLDEYIDITDDYEIDREKVLNFKQKLNIFFNK